MVNGAGRTEDEKTVCDWGDLVSMACVCVQEECNVRRVAHRVEILISFIGRVFRR
jgi:hypothetical protein